MKSYITLYFPFFVGNSKNVPAERLKFPRHFLKTSLKDSRCGFVCDMSSTPATSNSKKEQRKRIFIIKWYTRFFYGRRLNFIVRNQQWLLCTVAHTFLFHSSTYLPSQSLKVTELYENEMTTKDNKNAIGLFSILNFKKVIS